jgi:DNA-binding NarL/FixJ family response regulator
MPRVLVADDHAVVRRYIREVLEEQTWEVCGEAATGREAVTLADLRKPDIVVLDLSMPELNGIEAAREIRNRSPWIKVVILTMHKAQELMDAAAAAGATACIMKSDLDQLVAAVRSASEEQAA